MAANLMGGPKFKMPRVPCGDEVERIVEKGKARANTGASASIKKFHVTMWNTHGVEYEPSVDAHP